MKIFNIFFCVYSFPQINVLGIELHEINQVVKQLEKEVYFISYDRARKDKLIQNISTDSENAKQNKKNDIRASSLLKKMVSMCDFFYLYFHFILLLFSNSLL